MAGPVLVVGATGGVGSKVVAALRARGKDVRALVRPGSDASRIEGPGVTIARGDLMDPSSLDAALAGADAVITSAAGYTRRKKGDSDEIDKVGNANLVDAAKAAGTRRFVLCGILNSDQAPDVPHFHHKTLAEERLVEKGVPFVSLRPGAFLDQSQDYVGDGVKKGRFMAFGFADVPWSFVYTPDLARYLAAAVDLPPEADGARIPLGWDRALTQRELCALVAAATGKPLAFRTIPWLVVNPLMAVAGLFNDTMADLRAMLRFFGTGRYVADTTLQAKWFDVPTAEDAVARWAATLR